MTRRASSAKPCGEQEQVEDDELEFDAVEEDAREGVSEVVVEHRRRALHPGPYTRSLLNST